MNIKKKHHFVSQFYLRNWLIDGNEKLCVWDGHDKYFFVGTENIAHSRSFYRIVNLSEKQIELFDQLAEKLYFTDLSEYKNIIKPTITLQKSINFCKKLKAIVGNHKDIEQAYEKINLMEKVVENNTLEDKFSIAEEMFSILLKKIIDGNIENIPKMTLKDYDLIAYFIAFQLSKTPKKIEKITSDDGTDIYSQMIADYDFDEDQYHTFTLFTILCATEKLYLSILNKLYKVNVYYNNSEINFITSDDPCFNQKFDQQQFYVQLPISPKVMIEITENKNDNKEDMIKYYEFHKENMDLITIDNSLINFIGITAEQVLTLNYEIEKNKKQFIYASNKEDFLKLTCKK